MNKRNELRKRNIELYLKKNIFSGKYVVRNLMAATIAVSSVAGIVGATTVIADSVKDEAGDSIVVAEEDTQKVLGDISYASIPQLSSDSIGVLLADMELNETMDIASRQAELVTYALGEFDTKFVGIADDVNVHSEASTDAEVVGTISKGVVGDIISSDGEWVYISSGDVTGYVNAEYILTGDEAGEYASDYYTVVGTVNDNGVYVRSKASKDSVYVATANNGDRYDVEDLSTIDSEWVCVQVDENVTGYIYSEYIDVEGSYPTAVAKLDLPEATGSISVVKADKPQATGDIKETKNDSKPADTTSTEKPADTTESANGPTQVVTTARGAVSLSEEDINLMASVLTLECGGESYEGQLAVANVILNRLESGRYGSTISDVVYAPSQFSVVGTEAFNNYVANGAQASCIQAVREACAGTNNIGSYMYFRPQYNANISSYTSYTIIGNHVFF